jgi:hypothetical protein
MAKPSGLICDKVRENNDITLLLVLSKASARRLGKARDANVSRPVLRYGKTLRWVKLPNSGDSLKLIVLN